MVFSSGVLAAKGRRAWFVSLLAERCATLAISFVGTLFCTRDMKGPLSEETDFPFAAAAFWPRTALVQKSFERAKVTLLDD